MDVDQITESTEERLRAFEDKVLGAGTPRHQDKVERGHGSPFAKLDDQHKAHHAALESLIEAERAHTEATASEDAAHKKLEAAIKRVTDTGKDL